MDNSGMQSMLESAVERGFLSQEDILNVNRITLKRLKVSLNIIGGALEHGDYTLAAVALDDLMQGCQSFGPFLIKGLPREVTKAIIEGEETLSMKEAEQKFQEQMQEALKDEQRFLLEIMGDVIQKLRDHV